MWQIFDFFEKISVLWKPQKRKKNKNEDAEKYLSPVQDVSSEPPVPFVWSLNPGPPWPSLCHGDPSGKKGKILTNIYKKDESFYKQKKSNSGQSSSSWLCKKTPIFMSRILIETILCHERI